MTAFRQRVREAVADDHLHLAIERATGQLRQRRGTAFESLEHAEAIRDSARRAKLDLLANLDRHLEEFEARLVERGVHVHWAEDGAAARRIVLDIARARGVRSIVKSKSMVTEEIHLNETLIGAGLDVLETDLGEYIVQLREDRPSHIILPIIHLTREDVGRLFEQKLAVPFSDAPAELAAVARRVLRQKFVAADMGVTGANFGVVESGSICLVSNEGNIRMCTSLPRVHVAVLGIEKLLPTLVDLDHMLKLLARSATGQKISVYTSLIQGPRREPGEEGPEEVHVVLLDNGRTSTLAGGEAEMLACIRCGACLNACPVYRQIGGHAYGDTYPGPMGSILTPSLRGLESWQELPQASSLCGACKDVCPVRIDIPRMLLDLRRQSARDPRSNPATVRWMLKLFGVVGTRPRLLKALRKVGGLALRGLARDGWVRKGPGLLGGWTRHRDLPAPRAESFEDWWRRRRNG